MDELIPQLQSFLQQHFEVTPVRTQRQDQWYKRSLESWRLRHPTKTLVILSPKRSRDEWMPDAQRLAASLARAIRDASAEERHRQDQLGFLPLSSNAKVFADAVLEDDNDAAFSWHRLVGGSDTSAARPLKPVMQREAYWTEPWHLSRTAMAMDDRVDAIKSLLARGQTGPLLRLACLPSARLGDAAQALGRREALGWQRILDEAMETLLFLGALASFPETLAAGGRYEAWAPMVFAEADAPAFRYIQSRPAGWAPSRPGDVRRAMDWCFGVLGAANLLTDACGLGPLDLEARAANALLGLLGFEAWNRQRQGVGYLGCDLNVAKDEAWLRRSIHQGGMLGAGTQASMEAQRAQSGSTEMPSRSRDPLRLRAPKEVPVEEPDSDDEEKLAALESMEIDELAYGRRRSNKYRRRKE
jgi:hypothetical protein